jgi:hypothetical protein
VATNGRILKLSHNSITPQAYDWVKAAQSILERRGMRPGLDDPYLFRQSLHVLSIATLAIVPWIKWSQRFSLRTLLFATTLVAVVLGLVVAMK